MFSDLPGTRPLEVQRIINKEEGELVPCRRVQNYIIQNNLTFDLEVLCMLRLSTECSIAALGAAYGPTKSVVLAIEVAFNIGLAVARKGKHAKQLLKVAQTLTITVVILAILIVPASIHEMCGPRNSVFDFHFSFLLSAQSCFQYSDNKS